MILQWVGDQAEADAAMIAVLYAVSARTVQRYCPVLRREPRAGRPRGLSGVAWYDPVAAATHLAGVTPRPARALAALRYRAALHQQQPPR